MFCSPNWIRKAMEQKVILCFARSCLQTFLRQLNCIKHHLTISYMAQIMFFAYLFNLIFFSLVDFHEVSQLCDIHPDSLCQLQPFLDKEALAQGSGKRCWYYWTLLQERAIDPAHFASLDRDCNLMSKSKAIETCVRIIFNQMV